MSTSPSPVRRRLALLAVATLLVTASACSSDGDDEGAERSTTTTTAATTTSTTEPASPVDEWAASFCGAFGTWLDAMDEATTALPSEVAPGDYAATKAAKVAQFDAAAAASTELIDALGAVPPPAVDDGDALVAELDERFSGVEASFEAASADVAALAEDPATFDAQLGEITDRIAGELTLISSAIEGLDESYPSPELDDAIAASCTF